MATVLSLAVRPDAALAAVTAGAGFGVTVQASGVATPYGLAFGPGGSLFVIGSDATGSTGLYSVAAAGGVATRIGALAGQPRGAAFSGGALYVARHGALADGSDGDIVEVSVATGAVLRTVAPVPCANGLAAHPTTGDLYVTTCQDVIRVRSPGGTPVVDPYFGGFLGNAGAIVISAAGTVFVTANRGAGSCLNFGDCANMLPRDTIWQLGDNNNNQSSETLVGQELTGITLVGVDGTQTSGAPKFYFVNDARGTITKIRTLDSVGVTKYRTVSTGGGRSSFAVIGPDNCLYASQTDVLKVAKAGTPASCDLESAGEEIVTLGLDWSPGQIGFPTPAVDETIEITGTLEGVESVTGMVVNFDITGPNASRSGTGVLQNFDSVAKRARFTFRYTGAAVGTDTIAARTTYLGAAVISSNTLPITWRAARDTTPPVIRAKVQGTAGAAGAFACILVGTEFREIPASTVGASTGHTACGWYTSVPMLTWEVLEPESPATLVTSGCTPVTFDWAGPPEGTPFTCTASSEGGTGITRTVYLQIALRQPGITVAATAGSAPYAGVPTNQAVTVVFTCDAAYLAAPTAGVVGPFMTCDSPGAVIANGAVVPQTPVAYMTATRVITAEGVHVVSGTVTDVPGRTATASVTVTIDRTAPNVYGAPDRQPNAAGWYNADVSYTFSCRDDAPALVQSDCTLTTPATATFGEGVTTPTASGRDGAGNVTTKSFDPVQVDKTRPTVQVVATSNGAPYVAGTPTQFPVTFTFVCADPGGSGVASCPAPLVIETSGPGPSGVVIHDLAGNASLPTPAFGQVNISRIPTTLTVAPQTSLSFSEAGATVQATLSTSSGPLGGRTVTFSAGGFTASGVTNAAGVATATLPLLYPDSYALSASFAESPPYLASNASGVLHWAPELGRTAMMCGKVQGAGVLRNGAKVEVNVHCDGKTVRGRIAYESGRNRVVITRLTGFGLTPDLRLAFIYGQTADGKPVVVMVRDTKKSKLPDELAIRVSGSPLGGSGPLERGNLHVHQPSSCGKPGRTGGSSDSDSDSDSDD